MKKRKKPMESDFIDAGPVRIIKGGEITLIAERDLKKGDIIVFQSGDIIPADIKLLEARNLEVDEFDLTGEIRPVRKTAKTSGETKISDRIDYILRGTRVLRGNGKGIVMSTGEDTEYGKILSHATKISDKKSRLLKYDFKSHLLRHLYLQPILIPALLLLLLKKNMDFKYAFLSYLIANIWLIIFEHQIIFNYIILKMANKNLVKKGIIIKDYSIFDSLKDVDVICFDKTGVITSQDMEVTELYIDGKKLNVRLFHSLNNNLFKYIMEGCALCNDIIFLEKTHSLDRIDSALINFAKVQGFNVKEIRKNYERIYEIPFNSENRFMMAGYRRPGRLLLYIKGDPEVITNKCSKYMALSGEIKKIDAKFIFNIIEAKNEAMKSGNSVIAMAFKELYGPEVKDSEETLSGGYVFLTLILLSSLIIIYLLIYLV
jgi:Ca2+-transporting ATPase